jgi:hypothetical protein
LIKKLNGKQIVPKLFVPIQAKKFGYFPFLLKLCAVFLSFQN